MIKHAGQQVAVVGSACRTVPTATMDQIKAARILLGWSESILAKRSRRTTGTIRRAEAGRLHADLVPSVARSMQRALEDAGVEFLNHGQPCVRLKASSAAILAKPVEVGATNDKLTDAVLSDQRGTRY